MDTSELREDILANTELSFSRSSGPGGQNVNKRDTKVTVKLAVDDLKTPGDSGIEKIKRRLSTRISSEGNLVIQADGERSQARNREEALQRLEDLILHALRPDPRPRKKTKPSRAARERRIRSKKKRSLVKNKRRSVSRNGDD
ncbi:MAG: aminoacyl-tRNA hydrolase [Spirochaetaceae bacterium]|nr:aminoacyl-tRNA hydrolase [Spirochaetaceae bacterium]